MKSNHSNFESTSYNKNHIYNKTFTDSSNNVKGFIFSDQNIQILYDGIKKQIVNKYLCNFPEHDTNIYQTIKKILNELSNTKVNYTNNYTELNNYVIQQCIPFVESLITKFPDKFPLLNSRNNRNSHYLNTNTVKSFDVSTLRINDFRKNDRIIRTNNDQVIRINNEYHIDEEEKRNKTIHDSTNNEIYNSSINGELYEFNNRLNYEYLNSNNSDGNNSNEDKCNEIEKNEIEKKETNYEYDISLIQISSGDFPITAGKKRFHRFSFNCGFQREQSFQCKIPIFENYPFILDSSGKIVAVNEKYDINNSLGKVTNYISYNITNEIEGINIQKNYFNVTSIIIDYVYIYTGSKTELNYNINLNPTGTNIINYPFILLEIEELISVYSSTNKNEEKNVIKLIQDKTHNHNSHNFSCYRTLSNEAYTFLSPLSSLNRLTFNIKTPQGTQFYDSTDIAVQISSINVVTISDRYYFRITLDKYIKYLNNDHLILLSDIKFYDKSLLLDNKTSNFLISIRNDFKPFNDLLLFLHDKNGHVIIQSEEKEYTNTFLIRYPSIFNVNDGTIQYKHFSNDCDVFELSNLLENLEIISGNILNLTIQSYVSMKIVTRLNKNKVSSENGKF